MSDGDEGDWETPRKLFVGGVSYDADDEALKAAFEQFGEIVDCVVIMDPHSKRSRGFGFVTFHDKDSIQKVFDCRPIKVEGRYVEVKRAVPRHETSTVPLKGATKKAFVGGIPPSVNEDQLRKIFEQFGPVTSIDIMRDKEGHSRGFAFVVFEDCEAVERVVRQQFIDIDGRKAECKRAEPFGSIQPTRSLEKNRRANDRYVRDHSGQYENPGPYNHPMGRGMQYNDMGGSDSYGSGFNPGMGAAGGFGNSGFGNPAFMNPGFGNTGFRNPGFGNPGFGNQVFGNPSFGNTGFGNTGFGNAGFGNMGFGTTGFGNSGFGTPGFATAGYGANAGFPTQGMGGMGGMGSTGGTGLPTNPVTPAAASALPTSLGSATFPDMYSSGFNRGAGLDGTNMGSVAATTDVAAQLAAMGGYNSQASSFGPTRAYHPGQVGVGLAGGATGGAVAPTGMGMGATGVKGIGGMGASAGAHNFSNITPAKPSFHPYTR